MKTRRYFKNASVVSIIVVYTTGGICGKFELIVKRLSYVGTVSSWFKSLELRPERKLENIHHLDSFTRLSSVEHYYKIRCFEVTTS